MGELAVLFYPFYFRFLSERVTRCPELSSHRMKERNYPCIALGQESYVVCSNLKTAPRFTFSAMHSGLCLASHFVRLFSLLPTFRSRHISPTWLLRYKTILLQSVLKIIDLSNAGGRCKDHINIITESDSARDLGLFTHSSLDMTAHISSAFMQSLLQC